MLAQKPSLIIVSKIDLATDEVVKKTVKSFGKKKVIPVSSETGENLDALLRETEKLLGL